MTPQDYLEAARVPSFLAPQRFGGVWEIERRVRTEITDALAAAGLFEIGWPDYTLLRRATIATLHHDGGEIVMEDSLRELRRHLPIWLAARGRVLVTGLGLGCVVRGLLASPDVEHIDVVELDAHVLRVIGAEFVYNDRVTLHHGDALKFKRAKKWDVAWHDLWCEGPGLHRLHIALFKRFNRVCKAQGAWMLPRVVKTTIRRRGHFALIG